MPHLKVVNLVKKIATQFVKRKLTLGFAESCTGGQASAAVTARSGSSKYFFGGLVCYANQTKHDLLGVKKGVLKKHGAVSEPVAIAMAKGAKKALKVDWALSLTGIAGPTGGTPDKPVGLVHFGIVGPSFELSARKVFKGSRTKVQKQATEFALQLLLKSLKS